MWILIAAPLAYLAVHSLSPSPAPLPPPRLLAPPQFDPAQVRPPSLETAAVAAIPFERTLGRGESLAGLLGEIGLPPRDRVLVSDALASHVELRRLKPGLRVSAMLGAGDRPAELRLDVPGKGKLQLASFGGDWRSDWQAAVETVELRRAQVEIRSTVAEALVDAGAPIEVAYRAADVLRWDVDFTRDLRQGDRLQVLYEQQLVDGRPAGIGAVLAVALDNRGRLIEAYRFGDDEGYYDASGRPLRKMFLRSPIAFSTRITSGFTKRRFHPILKEFRPHWGIDLGAPTGTPVHVTANGVVLSAGWDGGGGRTVKVRHPSGYVTCYLHLSRFGHGIARGARVQQNQVIGYVGESGLATAPHLDYRVQLFSRWVDPLSLKSVPAAPLSRREMAAFSGWREQLRLALRTGEMPRDTSAGDWQLASADERIESDLAAGGR